MATLKTSQILAAAVLGTIAYNDGLARAPFFNVELQKMFIGRKVGETPKGEASTIEIMKAYTSSWDAANLAKGREVFAN